LILDTTSPLAFFSYSLATVFWVFIKDYKYFFARKLGSFDNRKHPVSEWLFLFLTKLLYYTMMIAVPLLVLDITVWQFVIGFLTLHLIAGLILGVVFQLAHVVEETTHVEHCAAGVIKQGWMAHELQTTNNFGCGNRLLSWYVGGLNHQIEHHLFPRICHVHYPALSRIVEDAAAKHGLPYNSHRTLWMAIRSHYRTLKSFGDPAYQSSACPDTHWSRSQTAAAGP
jgi:linoleoyl-CoA desaturase